MSHTEYITQVAYKYIIKGQDKLIVLDVDPRDVIQNADGELDCPLDTVLRRNQYSLTDLNNWNVQTIEFVEIINDTETVLRRIDLNMNM